MSLFKGMCALTGMANKLMEQRPMFQLGKQAASRELLMPFLCLLMLRLSLITGIEG